MKKELCIVKGCVNHGKYCRQHLSLQIKEQTTIEKESEKRKIINREYAKKARQFVKDNPACQASIEGMCTGKSQCVHHKKGKNSKEDLLDENFWLAVCFSCHRAIEENPAWAKQQGFSISRHAKNISA